MYNRPRWRSRVCWRSITIILSEISNELRWIRIIVPWQYDRTVLAAEPTSPAIILSPSSQLHTVMNDWNSKFLKTQWLWIGGFQRKTHPGFIPALDCWTHHLPLMAKLCLKADNYSADLLFKIIYIMISCGLLTSTPPPLLNYFKKIVLYHRT